MDCQKVKRYLALYLDSELSPELTFEISSHLDDCDGCRRTAELEDRLERRLRERLRHPEPGDDATWSRAVDAAIGRGSRWPKRRVRRSVALVAIAATVSALAVFSSDFLAHDELDLAEAASSAHIEYEMGQTTEMDVSGKAASLNKYFQQELSPEFCMEAVSREGWRILGANLSNVNGIRAAHLVYTYAGSPVSLFWFPKPLLAAFPETQARMRTEGSDLHCRIDPYEFYVNQAGSGILIGIGDVQPDILESFVSSAVLVNCLDR